MPDSQISQNGCAFARVKLDTSTCNSRHMRSYKCFITGIILEVDWMQGAGELDEIGSVMQGALDAL